MPAIVMPELGDPRCAECRTVVTDIIVGIAMMILSLACGIAYSIILKTIWSDPELMRMTSYRFMFMLGLADVAQCFPHFVTGLFTIFQTTWSPIFAKAMGVIATPCYVAYAVMTIILAFQRVIQLVSSKLERILFCGVSFYFWLAIDLVFLIAYMIMLSSKEAAIIYLPEWYSWDYDYELEFSSTVQRIEMYIELGGIGISGIFYVIVVVLLANKRKRFTSSSNYTAEVKILIQAAVITVYCTILNFFWHNYSWIFPNNLWTFTALNFMWIGNSGVYPVIYFITNRAIRDRIRQKKIVGVVTQAFTKVHSSQDPITKMKTTASNRIFTVVRFNNKQTTTTTTSQR